MGTHFQVASIIASIAFIVLVGIGFLVILSVPELARQPAYAMIATAVAGIIITPVIGWVIATRIMKAR